MIHDTCTNSYLICVLCVVCFSVRIGESNVRILTKKVLPLTVYCLRVHKMKVAYSIQHTVQKKNNKK